jgi:hypothetical protein
MQSPRFFALFVCLSLFIGVFDLPNNLARASDYSVIIGSDLDLTSQSLPPLLKPGAHPNPRHINDNTLSWWQQDVDPDTTGTYFVKLSLYQIGNGTDITSGSDKYTDLMRRKSGANVFVTIFHTPSRLFKAEGEATGCWDYDHPGNEEEETDQQRCAPNDYDYYQEVVEDLLTYLVVENDTMDISARSDSILGIDGEPTMGLDNLKIMFWYEANGVGWDDADSSWLKLYDYWIEVVRFVRDSTSANHFEVGVELQGSNQVSVTGQWNRDHDDLLEYLDQTFLPFLDSSQVVMDDTTMFYPYRESNPPPFDEFDFYAFNPRNNNNHHWIYDWSDDFYEAIQDTFSSHGYDSLYYACWSLQSGHTEVEALLLPGIQNSVFPDCGDSLYLGVDRDSEMGAAAQIAHQHDAWHSPVIDISYYWPEWLKAHHYCKLDPFECKGCYGAASHKGWIKDWDPPDNCPDDMCYPLYVGCESNAFSAGYESCENPNERSGGYAKASYNLSRMLGMQETLVYPDTVIENITDSLPKPRSFVGGVVTSDSDKDDIAILFWYYIPPEDLTTLLSTTLYDSLRSYANDSLGADFAIKLKNLTQGDYLLDRWMIGECHSNGFKYRTEIYEYFTGQESCNISALAINNTVRDTLYNDCDEPSIGLQQVEFDAEKQVGASGNLHLAYPDITPWTVMLIKLSYVDP